MFQASRALHSRLTTFSTPSISLHAQLILPLPRDGQVRVLVFNALSHLFYSRPAIIRLSDFWPGMLVNLFESQSQI
jgi:hypothetical protein